MRRGKLLATMMLLTQIGPDGASEGECTSRACQSTASQNWSAISAPEKDAEEKRGDAEDLVKWRTDYNAARREAVEKKRPIVIFFTMTVSFFCEKFRTGTLNNAEVASILNEHFVPVLLDTYARNDNQELLANLDVATYPTLVYPNLVGYTGAPRLLEHLKQILFETGDVDSPTYTFNPGCSYWSK